MHFDKIIMNPPYDRSLHLKILRQVMNKADEVVNLSPIRWLQDPLAEMKGNRADYGRFADIRNRISSLEVVDGKEANDLFGIDTLLDLGIYYLTGEGGFDTKNFWKQFKNPLVEKMITKLTTLDNLSNHYQANCLDGIRVPITKIGGNRGYKPVYKDLDYVIDGKKNGKDWTKCKNMGGYEKPENSPLPLSVKFDTEEEAKNFYKFFFSKIGTWICNITHCQQNIQFNLIPYLPDYTHSWTDEMLYEYFGLTDSEIQEIEQVV